MKNGGWESFEFSLTGLMEGSFVDEEKPVIKGILLKCNQCGVVWKKHYKQVGYIQSTGRGTSTKEKWIPSKEIHFCKPRPEIRKDLE